MSTDPNENNVHIELARVPVNRILAKAPVDRSLASLDAEATDYKSSSNTGAQTPEIRVNEASEGILCLVDYISCTFPSQSGGELDALQKMLGGEWAAVGHCANGYKHVLRCGAVTLLYGGRPDMGINLTATGDGCRELEARTVTDWKVFFGALLARGAKFCRVDVALDDYTNLLNLGIIEKWCRSGLVVSRFASVEPRQSICAVTGEVTKSGFTLGNRTSNTFLRIYDKALQEQKDGHHIRVELETKSKVSHKLACELAERGEAIIAKVISGIVDFKVRGRDSHRDRWKTQPMWRQFIGETEKMRLTVAPAERTLEKSMQALEKQYSLTMGMVDVVHPDKLTEIAENGKKRLGNTHHRLMEDYKNRSRPK